MSLVLYVETFGDSTLSLCNMLPFIGLTGREEGLLSSAPWLVAGGLAFGVSGMTYLPELSFSSVTMSAIMLLGYSICGTPCVLSYC